MQVVFALISIGVVFFILGYVIGTNAVMKVLPFVGSLNIAHDSDGEKYLSIAIEPKRADFMDNEEKKYVILTVKHLYSKEEKK